LRERGAIEDTRVLLTRIVERAKRFPGLGKEPFDLCFLTTWPDGERPFRPVLLLVHDSIPPSLEEHIGRRRPRLRQPEFGISAPIPFEAPVHDATFPAKFFFWYPCFGFGFLGWLFCSLKATLAKTATTKQSVSRDVSCWSSDARNTRLGDIHWV